MPRSLPYPPPNLYTKGLVLVSLNVIVISFLFSAYDVQLPVNDTIEWAIYRLYKISYVRRIVDTFRSLIGLSKYIPRQEIRGEQKPDKPLKLGTKLNTKGKKVYTPDQLALFDGSRESQPVYLAILGRVYDVEKGRKHYSAGGGYHFFAGKDATRAFITGDFTPKGLIDDVTGLSDQELLSLLDWVNFYNKEYKLVGFVQGLFYDANGKITPYGKEVNERLENALEYKKKQVKESEVFPPCNSEWHKDTGGRVWCTNKSGGVKREWVGVPRKLFAAGSKSHRCACVKNFGPPLATPNEKGNRGDLDNPNLKEYENCSPVSNSCKLPAD
ncbi:unnamed protein product [Bursaphelenchus xylophilus]|uniref:(pine wood nematode) hypothetical protein n=1 Tax=Bursaphelenchus xylophilus TaxID=6326 RepID=A0A1I7SEF8_BURXY|nr:unnamed protein product [Bursaphelenchus xylophilus]CAG9103978.1 unnamed protein product [Bursaphelenchus xylophilus]